MSHESAKVIDPVRFRMALGRFASGVTVVSTRHKERTHGMTASAFVSVSLEPPLVLVSLDNRSYMHKLLPSVGRCGISVLDETQEQISNHFAGRTVEGIHVRFMMEQGVPLLEGAVAHFVVEVIDTHLAGDHTLYIGRVDYLQAYEGKPLVFHEGQYRQLRADKIHAPVWPQDECW